MTSKQWCFTVHEPYLNDHPSIWLPSDCKYGFRYEYGIRHYLRGFSVFWHNVRGFVVFKERKSLTQVENLHATAVWEPMKYTVALNMADLVRSERAFSQYFTNTEENCCDINENDLDTSLEETVDSKTIQIP